MAGRKPHDKGQRPNARERLERAAYDLFARHGIRAVGVDTIVAHAGVAKRTLYTQFGSKDELALAVLRERERRWTQEWLQAEVERRATDPRQRLLAIFDLFDEWFRHGDYEACTFLKAILEHHDHRHPVRRAAVRHTRNIHAFISELARETGVADPDALARQWQMLMMGSIIAAYAGDLDAARLAKAVARQVLPEAK